MTEQWLRQCNLVVGNGSQATNLSELRVRFVTRQATVQAPGHADITITNPSSATASMIQKEYDKVVLQAGYPGNLATIFEGEIIQKRKGRENPTDTFLHILAKEGQQAYSYAVMSKTLAAGHTFRDQVNACLESMAPYGITAGYIADLGQTKMPRGRAMFGMVREQLRLICQTTGAHWRVTGSKLEIVKNNETRPGSAIVLNARTGLIGMPVQTFDGIEARCLLNPEIKPGSLVQINNASIQMAAISPNYGSGGQNEKLPSTDADGFYKVYEVSHHGDTRGTDWYSDIVCVAATSAGYIPDRIVSVGPSLPPDMAQMIQKKL